MKTSILLIASFFLWGIAFSQNTPIAVNDTATVMMYISKDIDVLANDYDPDGHPLEIYQIADSHNFAAIENNEIHYLTYPFPYNEGTYTFSYRIRRADDTTVVSNSATVHITVMPNPALPVTINDTVSGSSLFPITIYPMKNDYQNGADTLYISRVYNYSSAVGEKVEVVEDKVIYTPVLSFIGKGIDSISYWLKINDDPRLIFCGKIYVTIDPSSTHDSLDINNINAAVNMDGTLFADHSYPSGGPLFRLHYEVPKGSGKHTIFDNRIWLGGLDNTDSLHLAGGTYDQIGHDFRYGPVADSYDSLFTLKYARVWKLTRQQIAFHRNNWWKTGYQAIDAIATWPGNGDVNNGEADQLAPYFDRNNNGVYEPYDGDYPLIRGDEAVFSIMSDDCPHTETQGGTMKVEFQTMVYGYDAPEDDVLFNTVFVHYTLINRSENDYHDCYVGFFTDTDIGYAWDDYIGSFVDKSSFYGYNGKPVDGQGEPNSYGDNPPAQSITFLYGPLMDADGIDNPAGGCDYSVNGQNFGDGIADNERMGMTAFNQYSNGGDPHSGPNMAFEYYNLLQGKWRNGTPVIYGGIGFPTDSGTAYIPCSFMYPGASDPCNWGTGGVPLPDGYDNDSLTWTEFRAHDFEPNPPGDRRGSGSSGPFSFPSGQVQEIEMAYVTSFGNDSLTSVEKLHIDLDSLFAKKIFYPDSVLSVAKHITAPVRLNIYPNPASEIITLVFQSPVSQHFDYKIYNAEGSTVKTGTGNAGMNISMKIGGLKAGVYIVKVFTKKGVFFGKFMKL